MPNIGFMELLLISIVALLVLGPEKLPQAVRTAALWVGRARRGFNKVRAEIEREINADDIRRQIHNESIMADLDEAKEKASRLTRDTKDSFAKLEKGVRPGLDGDERESQPAGEGKKPDGTPTEKQLGDKPASGQQTADTTAPDTTVHEPENGRESRSEAGDPGPDDEPDRQAQQSEHSEEQKPVTDFYNNPPDKVTVQGRKFKTGKDDDDKA